MLTCISLPFNGKTIVEVLKRSSFMVKGVNKRVIEVNNTGNKFFEKIVFYVTPEYGNLTSSQLQAATEYLSLNLMEKSALRPPLLRKRRKLRKKRVFLVLALIGLAALGVVLKIIL